MKKVSEVAKELKALGCNEKVATDLLVACGILENDEKFKIEIGGVYELSWRGDKKPEYKIHVVGINKKEALCSFVNMKSEHHYLESHSLEDLKRGIVKKISTSTVTEYAKNWIEFDK